MKSIITRIGSLPGTLLACSLAIWPAAAEDINYPTHPVRVIAASAAGGNPDVIARILSARLSEVFNNPFVVEDVPGVGGVIAAKQTAAARPDGYTIGLNDSGSLGWRRNGIIPAREPFLSGRMITRLRNQLN